MLTREAQERMRKDKEKRKKAFKASKEIFYFIILDVLLIYRI